MDKYIIGIDKLPGWLSDELSRGRAKIEYEEGRVVSITIFNPSGTQIGKPYDVVIKTQSGLAIITGEKAKKYKLYGKYPINGSKRRK